MICALSASNPLPLSWEPNICLFISTYNDIHMYSSGYYVEVKDDDDKKYYCKEKDKDKEGWLKWEMGR